MALVPVAFAQTPPSNATGIVGTSTASLGTCAVGTLAKFDKDLNAWKYCVSSVWTLTPPAAHAASHASGGSDPVTIATSQVTGFTAAASAAAATAATATAGYSGTATIANTDVSGLGTSATKDVAASGDATSGQVVKGSDSRLTDSRSPTAHAASHAAGGGDAVTLTEAQITNLASDLAGKLASVTVDSPLSGLGTSGSHLLMASATTSVDGYLTHTDWNTFNGKGSGSVTSVSGSSPLTGTVTTSGSIGCQTASGSQAGCLSLTDWNTFNGKVSTSLTLTAGVGLTGGGDLSANRSFAVDSTQANFITSGALTCGAGTQGKAKVHTTPLQYCDNAATPALQYAAYGNSSGVATSALTSAALSTAINLAGGSGVVTGALPRANIATGTAYQLIANDSGGALTGITGTTTGNLAVFNGTAWTSAAASGDWTIGGTGTNVLATVNSNTGSCGDASHVCVPTLDGKGRATAASSTAIALAGSAITSGTVGATYGGTGADLHSASGALSVSSGTFSAGTLSIANGGTNATSASTALTNLGGLTQAQTMAIIAGGI